MKVKVMNPAEEVVQRPAVVRIVIAHAMHPEGEVVGEGDVEDGKGDEAGEDEEAVAGVARGVQYQPQRHAR